MRIALFAGLALWGSLAIGCGDKTPAKPTRQECTQAAEHIAELIHAHNTANPDQWWTAVNAEEGDNGIPKDVTKEAFPTWLATPIGQTWVMQRRGNTLSGVQLGIDPCVERATKPQVKCLLAAKSKEDVVACDDKHAKKLPASAAGGSTGSAESK